MCQARFPDTAGAIFEAIRQTAHTFLRMTQYGLPETLRLRLHSNYGRLDGFHPSCTPLTARRTSGASSGERAGLPSELKLPLTNFARSCGWGSEGGHRAQNVYQARPPSSLRASLSSITGASVSAAFVCSPRAVHALSATASSAPPATRPGATIADLQHGRCGCLAYPQNRVHYISPSSA